MAILRKSSPFLLCLLSVFQLFSVSAFSQPITTAEAAANVGQTKTVTGTVMKVTTLSKTVVLEIDGLFPNAPFTGVIFNEKLPAFDKATLESYKDKSISLTGKIAEYKGKPQIILNDPSQIALAGAASTPSEQTPASTQGNSTTEKHPAAPTNHQQQTTTADPAPAADKKNLVTNGNFNKGKKSWELPADAEIMTDGGSQVLQVKLVVGDRVYLKQPLETKIPKNAEYFEISADVKLAEGTKIFNGITFRLGQSFKESTYKKFEDLKAGTQTIKWPRTGKINNTENLILSIEFDQGEGSITLDNIELHPAR